MRYSKTLYFFTGRCIVVIGRHTLVFPLPQSRMWMTKATTLWSWLVLLLQMAMSMSVFFARQHEPLRGEEYLSIKPGRIGPRPIQRSRHSNLCFSKWNKKAYGKFLSDKSLRGPTHKSYTCAESIDAFF